MTKCNYIFFLAMMSLAPLPVNTEHLNKPVPLREIRDIDISGHGLSDLFVPHTVDGNIIGYSPTNKLLNNALAEYGVLAEDVITKMNGILLVNDKILGRALRKLVKAPVIELEILRDGKNIIISIPQK